LLVVYPVGSEQDKIRISRLTDAKDHYFSYLYTALFVKEVEDKWNKAGFDISRNADVVATIFNLGFNGSHPNSAPKVGGAVIQTGGKSYSFGELGGLFNGSDELKDLFPQE